MRKTREKKTEEGERVWGGDRPDRKSPAPWRGKGERRHRDGHGLKKGLNVGGLPREQIVLGEKGS